jgi:hypothetical protein
MDNVTEQNDSGKVVRLSEHLWEEASIVAIKLRCSLKEIMDLAVSQWLHKNKGKKAA